MFVLVRCRVRFVPESGGLSRIVESLYIVYFSFIMEQNFDAFELEYAQDYFTWALPKDTSAYTPREAGEVKVILSK